MISSGNYGLGPSGQSPGSSFGKGFMVVASSSMVVEASSVAGNLLMLPSIPARSTSSMVDEGISSSSLVGGIVSVHLAFGNGHGRLGDVAGGRCQCCHC